MNMSDRFESRLRDQLRSVESASVPGVDAVTTAVARAATRIRRRRRGAMAGASVALVGLAVTGIVVRGGDRRDPALVAPAPDTTVPGDSVAGSTLPLVPADPTAAPPSSAPSSAPSSEPPVADVVWAPIAPDPLGRRREVNVVWTGVEAIVLGGFDVAGDPVRGAAAYEPVADAWRTLPDPPGGATLHDSIGVWTGSEVVFLGGTDRGASELPGTATATASVDVLAFDPVVGQWRTGPSLDGAIADATSPWAWTGADVFVWPRPADPAVNAPSPMRYHPATDTWTQLDLPPIVPRTYAASVWTGSEWIVWGGYRVDGGGDLADGAAYHPATDTWRLLAESPLSPRRVDGVWTGSELIVLAGSSGSLTNGMMAHSGGAAYDPTIDTWRPLTWEYAHPGYRGVWTGEVAVMFAKGGAVVYHPATDATIDTCCNSTGAGYASSPVWTGESVILFGSWDRDDIGGATFTPPIDDPIPADPPGIAPGTAPT